MVSPLALVLTPTPIFRLDVKVVVTRLLVSSQYQIVPAVPVSVDFPGVADGSYEMRIRRTRIVGGVLYTLGAILFALHKPILSERWFGYHEVWHAFGIAAGVALYVANLGLVRAG